MGTLKRYALYLFVFICAGCALGISRSSFVPFEATVNFSYAQIPDALRSDFSLWDDGAFVDELSSRHLYDWDAVLKGVPGLQQELRTYSIELDYIKWFVRENFFQFSLAGSLLYNAPRLWDLQIMQEDQGWPPPNPLAIREFLTNPRFQASRDKVFAECLKIVSDPALREAWQASKDKYLKDKVRWQDKPGSFAYEDYERVKQIGFDDAMQTSLEQYMKILTSVNHADKVVPSKYGMWLITRLVDDYYTFLQDNSIFTLYSISYRIGPKASQVLVDYLQRAQKELLIKG
ncbi:MAG TPA: hypothetical protein PL188_08360 [Candidatus Cloacimonadota bacterium]|nr:hypothetical protein [Candidatus Cloacimonadota bacterium]